LKCGCVDSLLLLMMKFVKNKRTLIIIIFGILFLIIFSVAIEKYKYNKCVRINKEELEKCESGKLGNYDCSVFENAEELCSYRDDSDRTLYR